MTDDTGSKSEDLWNPYKDLKSIIWKHLNENEGLSIGELEGTLRCHKQNFLSLLQNPPKNAKSREDLKKGMVDGIAVKGIGHQILSKELYQEAIILSDMFELNEFVALDLLCTAQIQMPYYPSLPRGLVAVLLYYDGRKALVSSLLYLVQARSGIQWCINVKPDTAKLITEYTNQLVDSGIFHRIFELLNNLDLSKELELLQQNLALGDAKHRRQVIDLFNDTKVMLGDIVFRWAAQTGLPEGPTIALIKYLREVRLEEEASGTLDDVTLYLITAFLSSLDLSVLHSREDGEELIQLLPVLSNPNFIQSVLNEMSPKKPKWASEGLQGLAMFGVSVCLASLHILPQNHQFQEIINQQEQFINCALEHNIFTFMYNNLLENKLLYKEIYVYKRYHNLLTDFIVFMYPKVKEMRLRADEIARTMQVYQREGLEAPAGLPRYFEYLLLSIGKFYSNNQHEEDYLLSFWSPIDINPNQSYSYRAPARAVSLFKFIRLTGEMLPSTLFVPCLTMLSGLASCPQTARHCFNFLKQPGSLSWDHFFSSFSLYYSNLRQESPANADTVYRNRPGSYHKGVSPQELDGLHAVLLLIRTVAEQDEFSRLALCEHPGWAPLSTLLGLISCSVPIPLKADLLLTLAALSKSPGNATQMWENLEASQILVTIPTTASYSPRGIQTELDEIESRLEEYPLTKSLLILLDTLTTFGIPRTLGAGPRKPGFDPYLSFIINSVFLKYQTRSYRNPTEKWEVALLCLKLFEKFLTQYDPCNSDFPPNNAVQEFNSPPGFHLMVQLNSKSEVLNVILDIIDEGSRLFDSYVNFTGQEQVKKCTLTALNIINRVLTLQSKFFNLLANSTSSIILKNLNKLLLTINRRSGKPDHCINIAKYACYQINLTQHALAAVKILNSITNSPSGHTQFLNILMSLEESKKLIKSGLVECLDSLQEGSDEITETKLEILKLLKQCLVYNSPNLTHYLLGFNLKREISKTEFQYPGVLDFPRSCLHSIISLMDSAVAKYSEPVSPLLLESVYHFLYLLAFNVKTSGPVLRFVRLNKSFFIDQLTHCLATLQNGLAEFNQMTWLLKTLAIELKIACQNKQVSYVKLLTTFLVNIPERQNKTDDSVFALISKRYTEFKMLAPEEIRMETFMSTLIKCFEVKVPLVETPSWEFFDTTLLTNTLKSFQIKSNTPIIDLKRLHQHLYDELRTLQNTAMMGQIQAISQEIPKILKYALEINKRSETCSSVVQFVNAWRQVAEVLVIYPPEEIVALGDQQVICISLAHTVLQRIVKIELQPEVSRLLSGAILLFIDCFKNSYSREIKLQKIIVDQSLQNDNLLELYQNALKEILGFLLDWILTSNVTDGELRTNLYASLVTFLQLINTEKPAEELSVNSMYVSRLDSTKSNVVAQAGSLQFTIDTISKYGNKLIEVLCQDSTGSQEICKILAMSSLSHLIELSGNMMWVQFMSGKGFLKYIVQSILDSDEELRLMLEPTAESIKPLYLYLGKMFLLSRITGTRIGAEFLLEQKLLSAFSNMSVFKYHPEISKFWQRDDIFEDLLPPIEQQYLQIWMPTLEICNAILTTLGTENQSAIVQIMYFIISHMDVVELILRSGDPHLSPTSLKELSLVTFVLARTANNKLINVLENPNIVHNQRAQLFRIQKLMLALLPKFIISEETVKNLTSNTMHESNLFQTSDRLIYGMQIMSNLLCYSRNIVANHGIEHAGVGVIFYPTLIDPLTSRSKLQSSNEQDPSLGVIVQQLISTVNYQHQEKITHDLLARKISEIEEMNATDLHQFVEPTFELTDLNSKRERAFDVIQERLQKKKQEMEYCAFIIENSLYLIWSHLDYYMLKAIPKPKMFGTIASNTSLSGNATLPSATEATWKVSTDVISNLKQGLVSLFNDSFSKQLLETAQGRSESDKAFVEALLRKIKRLVQFVPVK